MWKNGNTIQQCFFLYQWTPFDIIIISYFWPHPSKNLLFSFYNDQSDPNPNILTLTPNNSQGLQSSALLHVH